MKFCEHEKAFDLVKVQISGGSWQLRKQCVECRELFGSAVHQGAYNMFKIPVYQPPAEPQLKLFGDAQ